MCSTLAPEPRHPRDRDWPVLDLELRLSLMAEALPADAQALSGMDDRSWRLSEPERLAAFEKGEAEWWCAREETGALHAE